MSKVVTRGARHGLLVSNIAIPKAGLASLKGSHGLLGKRHSPLETSSFVLAKTDAAPAATVDGVMIHPAHALTASGIPQMTSDPRILVAIAAKQGVSV